MLRSSNKLVLLLLLNFLVFCLRFQGCFSASKKLQPDQSRFSGSAVFHLHGNVYPDGIYTVSMNVGKRREPYVLDIDTGSDLTWLQCDAPCVRCTKAAKYLYKPGHNLVKCGEPQCAALQGTKKFSCNNLDEQCDYEVAYADEGSSLGVLVRDSFPLRFTNGSNYSPRLAFGCGYDQQFGQANHPPSIDGVLGLGFGKSSIMAQLYDLGFTQNVLGHCLSGKGGGYLFFGDNLVPSSGIVWASTLSNSLEALSKWERRRVSLFWGQSCPFFGYRLGIYSVQFSGGGDLRRLSKNPYSLICFHDLGFTQNVLGHCLSGKGGGYLFFGDNLVPSSGIVWASTLSNSLETHYSLQSAELFYDGKSMGVKDLVMVFDTGSSYTYFNAKAYQAALSTIKKGLTGKPLNPAVEDKALPVCWKGEKRFKSVNDVKNFFKPLVLRFTKDNNAQLNIPPESYLIVTKDGNVCLGILNGSEIGLENVNLIGDISLQDKMVVYDSNNKRIGWVAANCDKLPSVDGDYNELFEAKPVYWTGHEDL